MLLVLLESGQVELPDPFAGDLEELAQYSIADVGGVVQTGHQLAELELDDVVDLLLRELLHRYRGKFLIVILTTIIFDKSRQLLLNQFCSWSKRFVSFIKVSVNLIGISEIRK